MIQRVQSIWLFLAFLALLSLFIFPSIQATHPTGATQLIKAQGVYEDRGGGHIVQTQTFVCFSVLTVLVALIPLSIIFFYKRRQRQLFLCYVTIGLILLHTFYFTRVATEALEKVDLDRSNYQFGLLLPSFSILFIMLAIRGIRKDEQLLRAVDRLR